MKNENKKGPKGKINPLGAFIIGSLWEIHFTDPPEVRVRLLF